MPLNAGPVRILLLSALLGGVAVAQVDTGGDGQLADRPAAIDFYAARERSLWRDNADKLAEIDMAFSAAVSALSEENRERLQAILAANNDAHKALRARELAGNEYAAEYERVQAETAMEREKHQAWYAEARKIIGDEHAAKRAAQFAATNALVTRLGEQRTAVLQRLKSGPINLESLPALQPAAADDREATSGVLEDTGNRPTSPGGGIDVAGTVDIDTPGAEIVANADPDRQYLRERLFNEEVERRRQAEEDAARRARERRMGWGSGSNNINPNTLDCDDNIASVYPGAPEVCNYVDDDCDGDVDEGVLGVKYLDRDGDLHGDPDESLYVCAQTGRSSPGSDSGDWLSTYGNDCDDSDPAIWQGCDDQ